MSSLFGNRPTQPTSTLFGNATTSQPQQQSQAPQTGSLFAGLGGSQQQSQLPQTGGLFASLGGSQPQQQPQTIQTTSNTFPSLGATTAPPGSREFFRGVGPAQLQPQTGLGRGLTRQDQPTQAQTSLQNGQTRSSQPIYFNNLLEKGRKRAHDHNGGQDPGDMPSLQLGLGDIAKRVREMGGAGSQEPGAGRSADSKAHYLLAASGVNPGVTRKDLNAFNSQPLATDRRLPEIEWDPDTTKYVNQMQQQSTMKMINEGLERAHRNFNSYLEEHVDINWEIQRRKIHAHFGLLTRGSESTFEEASAPPNDRGSFGRSTRRGRLGESGRPGHSSTGRSIFGNANLQKSVIGSPSVGSDKAAVFTDMPETSGMGSSAQDDRFMRDRQDEFGGKINKMNESRLRGARFALIRELKSVQSQPGGESPSQIIDAYQALSDVVEEDGATPRQYTDEYLDETPNSIKTVNIRRRILNGSRRCLERQFYDQLESLVAKNPREANIGGIPTTINKVRAYIRIRAARKDLVPDGTELQTLDSDLCWALIFFLLRCGFVKEAAEYVTSNSASFRALDRNFVTYITAYASNPDRRLPRSMQDRINVEYQQRARIAPDNSLDPYRMACYKIVGRCELSKRSIEGISQAIEDWIWLQFNLAREVNRVEEVAGDIFGLDEIRATIKEIGERHFSKGAEGSGGYGTYFFLQVLGGLYEDAVAYLYPHSYVAAVHFAIALDYYGLLRVSAYTGVESELLTHNTKNLPQIDFGRMIGYYTRDFRAGDVEAAVDYLTTICLNADLPGALGRSQVSLCHEALRELVLETREFAQLLGDIRSDGIRIKGSIEQRLSLIRLDHDDFLQTVTVQAASLADDNGRTADAVLLYHLAEDYDSVITIINRALSEAIAVEIGHEEMRLEPLKPRSNAEQTDGRRPSRSPAQPGDSLSLTSANDPVILARNMITLYNSNSQYYQKIKPLNREACGMLLRLSDAKADVAAERWVEALDIITSTELLPLTAHSSIPAIRAAAQAFNALPSTISRNIGPLLTWTITCIGKQREVLGSGNFGEATSRKEMSEQLLVAAKDLMVFAGLVKYRLGERVWEQVTRCGGDVGVY